MGQCPVVCLSHIDNDGTVARGVSTSRYPIVPSLFRPTMLYIKASPASMATCTEHWPVRPAVILNNADDADDTDDTD